MNNLKNNFFFSNWFPRKDFLYCICDFHCNTHDGMYSLIYNRRPPPLLFLPYLYGVVKPILNWVEGNESSSFVSEIRKISKFLSSIYIKESNLFLIGFMFMWLKIIVHELTPFFGYPQRQNIILSFSNLRVSAFYKRMMGCPNWYLLLKIGVFYRPKWTKAETTWKRILTIFIYKTQCYKQLEHKK